MASEQEFDDLLRKKLGGVKPPAPPAMDWSAMARAAKAGPSTARHASGAWPIWKLMIWAAAVSGIVWYGYTALQAPSATDNAIAAEMPHEVATDPGSSAQVPIEPVTPEVADAGEQLHHALRSDALPSDHRVVGENAPSLKGSVPSTMAVSATANTAVSTAPEVRGTTGKDDVVTREAPVVTNEEVTTSETRASFINMPVDVTSVALGDGDGQPRVDGATVEHASMDAATPMDALWPTAAPLSMAPNVPVAETPSNTAFPRFALSPWGSFARSIRSPAPAQLADQVDRLGGLNEWIGTAGVRLEYAFTPRLAVITGLQYSNKGRLQGTIRSSPEVNTDYAVSGSYLEVPLSMKYEFPQAGKTFYARSGVLVQFNARAGSDRVVMHDHGLKEMSTLALSSSSVGVALDLGAGVRFRLGRGLGLFIEPSYQYALSPVVKNAAFDRLPYNPRIHSFGLGTGLTFQFGSR